MKVDEGLFDPIIHAPHRLRIRAALSSVDEAEFAVLRDVTQASESVLSKQVKILEDASAHGHRLLNKENKPINPPGSQLGEAFLAGAMRLRPTELRAKGCLREIREWSL